MNLDLAQRIIDVDPYEAADCDETAETIAEKIKTDPETIIEFLLEIIEDYQA